MTVVSCQMENDEEEGIKAVKKRRGQKHHCSLTDY